MLFRRRVEADVDVGDPLDRRLVRLGIDELLQFGLRELPQAEEPAARGDLVAVGGADLGDPEREVPPGVLLQPRELHEDPLCRFRSEVPGLGVAGADVGREHEIERFDGLAGERGAAGRAGDLVFRDEVLDFLAGQRLGVLDRRDGLHEVVCAVGCAALAALDEHVVERVEVAGRLEDGFGHDRRRLDLAVPLTEGETVAPRVLDVPLEGRALRTERVEAGGAAVRPVRAEEEPAALREFDELVRRHLQPLQ